MKNNWPLPTGSALSRVLGMCVFTGLEFISIFITVSSATCFNKYVHSSRVKYMYNCLQYQGLYI